MTKPTPLHIQQNLTPERLKTFLDFAAKPHPEPLSQIANHLGLKETVIERLLLPFVRQIGLIETKTLKNSAPALSLTDLGKRFHHLVIDAPGLFPEALHLLLYGAYLSDQTKRFSWAYAYVVRSLWQRTEAPLNAQTIADLVGLVAEEASQHFSLSVEKIAFSHNSIRGILNWLHELDPPVLLNSNKSPHFKRRYYCPPFLFLWAVDLLYKQEKTPTGVRMFLTPERADELCKACLLEPSALEDILKMAKRTSDYDKGGVFDYGTQGAFGQWILLKNDLPVPTLPETES